MTFISNVLAKGAIATVAAGAMAVTPMAAQASDNHNRIDAGDVIAGALIIGGIAAIASAAKKDRVGYGDGYRYRDRDYRGNYGHGYGQRPKRAVNKCIRAAERDASGHRWGKNAQVTDIRDIDRTRDGFRVKGRIAVDYGNRQWNKGDRVHGRDWNNTYRGRDSGSFTCYVEHGRVVDIDYRGIRGLH